MSLQHLRGHVHALIVKIVGQDGRSRSSQARHRHLRLLHALLKDWLELLLLPIHGAVLLLIQLELPLLSLHVVLVVFRLFLLLLLLVLLE